MYIVEREHNKYHKSPYFFFLVHMSGTQKLNLSKCLLPFRELMSVDVCLKEFCFVVFWFILRRHPCLHQNIRLTTDNSVLMDREKGGAGWRGAKGVRNGDICKSVNNKNKEKRIRIFFKYWLILENVKDQTEIRPGNLSDSTWVSGESRILMLSHYY